MKEFKSASQEKIQFRIDGEDFQAVAEVPARTMIEMRAIGRQIEKTGAEDADDLYDSFLSMFESVLMDESYDRFRDRTKSKDNPIGLAVMTEIMEWLLENYLGEEVPTEALSPSSEPKSADTQSSTAGALQGASTP